MVRQFNQMNYSSFVNAFDGWFGDVSFSWRVNFNRCAKFRQQHFLFLLTAALVPPPTASADLEWKVLYVGSAYDSHKDQVLDEILVGPVPVGLNKFVLQADPPSVDKLPKDEILGVTVVLVTCSYREREFVRVGYYVNNEYIPEEQPLQEGDLEELQKSFDPAKHLHRVQRQILADKPRVTKFPIPWGGETRENENPGDQQKSLEGTPSTAVTMDMDE